MTKTSVLHLIIIIHVDTIILFIIVINCFNYFEHIIDSEYHVSLM